jgi:hypothetical protein
MAAWKRDLSGVAKYILKGLENVTTGDEMKFAQYHTCPLCVDTRLLLTVKSTAGFPSFMQRGTRIAALRPALSAALASSPSTIAWRLSNI